MLHGRSVSELSTNPARTFGCRYLTPARAPQAGWLFALVPDKDDLPRFARISQFKSLFYFL